MKAGGKASLELKSLLMQGALDEVLANVRQQQDHLQVAPNPYVGPHYSGAVSQNAIGRVIWLATTTQDGTDDYRSQ